MSTKTLNTKPMCAACGHPVEEMTEEESADEVVWTARCHGERQRIRLGPKELAVVGRIDMGWAFVEAGKALPPIPGVPRLRALGPIARERA